MGWLTLGEIQISRSVYGLRRLGDDADNPLGHVKTKVEACLQQGITTMDQANIYGSSTGVVRHLVRHPIRTPTLGHDPRKDQKQA